MCIAGPSKPHARDTPDVFHVLGGPSPESVRKLQLWEACPDNALLWDIQLQTDDGPAVPANRLDLAACSEFFYCLLSSPAFADSTSRTLRLRDVEHAPLLALVRCLYSRELELGWANVEAMLAVSDRLQCAAVKDACTAFLQSRAASAPADVLAMATQYGCEEVRQSVLAHAVAHFDRLLAAGALGALLAHCSTGEVAGLLAQDSLALDSELDVLRGVAAWADAADAAPHEIAQALGALRGEHLSAREAEALRHDAWLRRAAPALQAAIARAAACAGSMRGAFSKAGGRRERTSRAVHSWAVGRWSQRRDALYSGRFRLSGSERDWRLLAFPRGNGDNKWLALYLCPFSLDGAAPAAEKLDFKLHVVNQAAPAQHSITKHTCHVFSTHHAHGFQYMVPLADLAQPGKGFVIDDTLVLQVSVPCENERDLRAASLAKALAALPAAN